MPRDTIGEGVVPLGLGLCLVLVILASGWSRPSHFQGTPPDETRFTKKVLVEGLDEAFQIDFDHLGRVYWIERSNGNVKRLDENTGEVNILGEIPTTVFAEGGLLGILLDRDFATTRQIYFYYTAVEGGGDVREGRLSRIRIGSDERLQMDSEVVLLRIPAAASGHMGGGMTWDQQGNLYLTTGDNVSATQYGTFRFTAPGGAGQDALGTSANTNDLRGKILRIRPQPDGTYTIPPGNLFPPGTPATRPEIFVMGGRNPWRVSIDSRTGFVHWGDIGPDAGRDSVGIGTMGFDEFNVSRGPGNFGWPLFIGYNQAYNVFDYQDETYGAPSDSLRPLNLSPNNTGLRELPPAKRPLIAYPYGVSEEYPELGTGGRAAIGGPVFHRADFSPSASRVFPEYYDGRWLVVDYVRNWIFAVTMSPESDRVVSLERVAPKLTFLNPIDMQFGPEGDLYVVEYARAPYGKISKIEYNPGNRAPRVTIDADRTAGAAPLQVTLSSAGTVDDDGDPLQFEWVLTPETGGAAQRFTTAEPTVTLNQPGAYRVVLTARDPAGATGTAEMRILAGNDPPRVALEVPRGNRSFHFPDSSIEYRVTVTDPEDGAIRPSDVVVTAEFIPSGLSPAQAEEARDLAPEASARHLQAFAIMAGSDCRACHSEETRMLGPSYREIAERYRGEQGVAEVLAQRIIAGSGGVWGQTAMPPHPTLTPVEATALAQYVLSVGQAEATPARLPLEGTYATPVPAGAPAGNNPARVTQLGSYLLRAAYTDRGAPGAAPITTTQVLLLRQPRIAPEEADIISEGTAFAPSRGDPSFVINRSGAHIGFRGIDLTGIDSIAVGVLTRFYTWSHFIGGTVEVRLDSPTGPLLGAPAQVTPPAPATPAAPPGGAPGGQGPQRPPNPSNPTVLGANLERPVSFPVGGAGGTRDVYVIFRNETAGPAAALFLVTSVEFKLGASGQ
jgi:cytochrome c